MKPKYKTVNYPMIVPKGDYCWESMPPYAICSKFSNEGGHRTCDIGLYPLEVAKDGSGVLKPPNCYSLKEENEA